MLRIGRLSIKVEGRQGSHRLRDGSILADRISARSVSHVVRDMGLVA